MKIFLTLAAVLAWWFGAMLLFVPTEFYAPTGMTLTPMLATLAQAHGATLVGLGFITWATRYASGKALSGILLGNLVMQMLSLGIVIQTWRLGAGNAVLPGIVIHIVLGSCFAYFWLKSRLPR